MADPGSLFPGDYLHLTIDWAGGTSPIRGYTVTPSVNDNGAAVELDGVAVRPPSYYHLTRAAAGNEVAQDADDVHTITDQDGHVQVWSIGTRSGTIQSLVLDGNDVFWHARGWAGLGGGCNALNEVVVEKFGATHNPTLEGGLTAGALLAQPTLVPSPKLYYRATRSGPRLDVVNGHVPLEFWPAGGGGGITDHGGGATTPVLWWLQQQWTRARLNVGGAGVHEFTCWSYNPRQWPLGQFAFTSTIAAATFLVQKFDTAWWFDPLTEARVALPGFTPAASPWGGTSRGHALFHEETGDVGAGQSLWLAPVTRARRDLIGVVENSIDGMAVGIYGRLRNDLSGDDPGDSSALVFLTLFSLFTDTLHGDGANGNIGGGMQPNSQSLQTRKRGWIGWRYWLATGTDGSDVENKLMRLVNGNVESAPVDFVVPDRFDPEKVGYADFWRA